MKHHENQSKIPLPESYFRALGIGSRATFWRWEKEGLRILKVGGRRFVRESDLNSFLENKDRSSRVEEASDTTGKGGEPK